MLLHVTILKAANIHATSLQRMYASGDALLSHLQAIVPHPNILGDQAHIMTVTQMSSSVCSNQSGLTLALATHYPLALLIYEVQLRTPSWAGPALIRFKELNANPARLGMIRRVASWV